MVMPKVSIVIPTYNRKDKLMTTISSIADLEYPRDKLQVIVVDDCSNEDIKSCLFKLNKVLKLNLEYFKTEENSGPAHARNLGVKKAKGKYIFFTDDDCLPKYNTIKIYVDFLEKNKNVAGASGYLIPIKMNIYARFEILKDKILKIYDKELKISHNASCGFTSNTMYVRKIFNEFKGFDENYKIPAGEDIELSSRISKKYLLATIPTKVYHNHDYNLDYIISMFIKQGLGEMPESMKSMRYLQFFTGIPTIILNIIKKVFKYKKRFK